MKINTGFANVALVLSVFYVSQVMALGTPAGSLIENQAKATYTPPIGPPVEVPSNKDILTVDEILQVSIVPNDASDVLVASPSTDKVLSFKVTNIGNGTEAYQLTFQNITNGAGDQFDISGADIWLDQDNNGIYDPSIDVLYVLGTNDPVFLPDGFRNVFIVGDIPASVSNNDKAVISVKAESFTALTETPGPDAPGTSFPGQGDAGSNAVVGSAQAEASNNNGFVVLDVSATFVKTSSVLDPVNQPGVVPAKVIPGAVISYTLTYSLTGNGSITLLEITDPIPTFTTYEPGSLALDGTPLTDTGADADLGQFIAGSPGSIKVTIGTVTVVGGATATKVVTFKVKVN